MGDVPFSAVADFVRQWCRLSPKLLLKPETQFEFHLGITGDDGCELLEAAEAHFRVDFGSTPGTVFDLRHKEYLFNAEGNLFSLFRKTNTQVRKFTLGDLHEGILKAMRQNQS